MTTVTIVQSSYIPWKGYFDLIARADIHVVYDVVQYTKRDWRNRNRIKTPKGTRWLTVPVSQRSFTQPIDEIEIADRDILARHWRMLEQNYAGAAAYGEMAPALRPLFERLTPELLTDLNTDLLRACCDLLGIDTPMRSSSDFDLTPDRTTRLVEICEQLHADTYLSGPAARDYLDVGMFADRGIAVEWMDYSNYPEYDQPHPPFDHKVSIVDLLLCTGERAREHLKYT